MDALTMCVRTGFLKCMGGCERHKPLVPVPEEAAEMY